MNYKEAGKMLGNRDSLKLRYETYLKRREDHFAIRHFETDVIRIYPRKTVYDCNGWRSRTTKDRLNDYGPGNVWSDKGVWLASYGDKTVKYADGVTFHVNGAVTGGDDVSAGKAEKKLRGRIRKYSKAYVFALSHGEVSKPDLGDCLDCRIFDGTPSDFVTHTIPETNHLLSHIEESYFVPSLVRNAVTAFPVSEVGKATLYYTWNPSKPLNPLYPDSFSEIAWEQIEKSIRRFLFQKLGLVR